MSYKDIITKISEQVDLPEDTIHKVYKLYWNYIKHCIQNLPLKEDLNESEFKELRTNFNIPSLGKLTCTYNRYLKVKEKFKYIHKIKDKNEKTN